MVIVFFLFLCVYISSYTKNIYGDFLSYLQANYVVIHLSDSHYVQL